MPFIKNFQQKFSDLLLLSEKYTGINMNYVVGGGSWLIIGRMALAGISFVLMIAFANWLPRETYGQYQYLIALFSILSVFTLPGVHISLVKSIAQKKEGTLALAVSEKIKWGLLGSFASLALALWYFLRGNIFLGSSFLLGVLFLPLLETFQIYFYFWNGRKRFDMQTKYEVLSAFLATLALLPAIYFSENILVIIAVFLVSHTFFDWILYKKTAKQTVNQEKDYQSISFGKHLTVMNFFSLTASYVDKLLLWKFMGAAQVAIYSFAQLPINKIINTIPLTSLALPKLGEQDISIKKAQILKSFYKLFFIFLPFSILLAIAAPFIYKILLPQYSESIVYFQALSLMIALAPFSLLSTALIAGLRQKDLYVINTVSPFLKIVLFIILTPIFGIWGAVSALLLSQFIVSCLTLFYFHKL